jgi:FkbM family methyltransferase|tara:strand:+ start:407 stop:994 length:588 start_codon:yes stop_codon:yes gene_type:complete
MKIIQIGANDGKDETFEFIKKNNNLLELVIIVEPIPFKEIQDSLKKQYYHINNSNIEQIAISSQEIESMPLFYLKDSNYEVSSFNYNHTHNHSPDLTKFPVCEIEVPCCSINKLMGKYNIKDLDYLFIDAEGLDVHIIGSIDFEIYNIKNIIFEFVHSDGPFKYTENLQEIISYLSRLGYKVEKYNNFCLKASKI